MADGLAKEATGPIKYPCHAIVQVGSVAYQDICCPYHISHEDTDLEDTSSYSQGAGTPVVHLTGILKDAARQRFQTGRTN